MSIIFLICTLKIYNLLFKNEIIRVVFKGLSVLLILFITLISIFAISMSEQHYDNYVKYKNIADENRLVIVQHYINWKHGCEAIDTSYVIIEHKFFRSVRPIYKMSIKGRWLKYNENGLIVDTIDIK